MRHSAWHLQISVRIEMPGFVEGTQVGAVTSTHSTFGSRTARDGLSLTWNNRRDTVLGTRIHGEVRESIIPSPIRLTHARGSPFLLYLSFPSSFHECRRVTTVPAMLACIVAVPLLNISSGDGSKRNLKFFIVSSMSGRILLHDSTGCYVAAAHVNEGFIQHTVDPLD